MKRSILLLAVLSLCTQAFAIAMSDSYQTGSSTPERATEVQHLSAEVSVRDSAAPDSDRRPASTQRFNARESEELQLGTFSVER